MTTFIQLLYGIKLLKVLNQSNHKLYRRLEKSTAENLTEKTAKNFQKVIVFSYRVVRQMEK